MYLVTCVLSLMLIAACSGTARLERGRCCSLHLHACRTRSGRRLCIGALQRYNFLLARAECFGEQSTCEHCRTYGVLRVLGAGKADGGGSLVAAPDNSWIRVQCKRCRHEWRIDNS